MEPRVFTRSAVEQFFNAHWGKSDYPKNELRTIALLPELDPPTWLIHYSSTWGDGDVNSYDLVVAQLPSGVHGQPYYLNLVTEVEIPVGLATVAQEDAAMKDEEE